MNVAEADGDDLLRAIGVAAEEFGLDPDELLESILEALVNSAHTVQ